MTAVTILIVELPPGRLLRIQTQLGIALATLHIAGGEQNQGEQDKDDDADRKQRMPIVAD
jgi:hypothetical protein